MKQRLAFALIMGIITTTIISFVLMAINIGFSEKFITAWLRSWSVAYVLAVSSMLLIAPKIQAFVNSFFERRFAAEKKS